MLNSFPVAVAAASILGFLAGLGIGGGSILLLWLTMIVGTDLETARLINLLFFLPAAGASCLFRWKQGCLNHKMIIPAALCSCIGAVLGNWVEGTVQTAVLKKAFGFLLIATGIREILYKTKKQAS